MPYKGGLMHSRRTLVLALTLAMSALASSTAFAQDSEEDPAPQEDPEPEVSTQADAWDRILAFTVTGGLDTPYGVAGAAVEVTPFRYLTIYAGGGVGRSGGRFAAGLHPQFPIGRAALGMMVGVSGGPLDWDSRAGGNLGVHRYWEFGLFVHTGATFEYRWDNGFFGRLEAGAEMLVTPWDATSCTYLGDGSSCGSGTGLWAPFRGWIGLSLGYALDL
jgi:hypothetical protein